MEHVIHPFAPVYNKQSAILILGTIPSPKSRLYGFYYSHPQNAFWPVLSALLNECSPETPAEKTAFLLRHHIALWDVLYACNIKGASDSHITRPVPNDFTRIFKAAQIQAVFTTGKKATELYTRLCEPQTGRPAIYLPSTSPANRRWYSFPRLLEAYRVILPYLQQNR